MKPMVLADIAQAVEMHESTISRVTTQKYLHSPRGIFELKYFFSSHVNTEGGGEASSTAIRALVKKLIAAENPAKPLSDSKLTSAVRTRYHGGAPHCCEVPRVFIHSAVKPTQTASLTQPIRKTLCSSISPDIMSKLLKPCVNL